MCTYVCVCVCVCVRVLQHEQNMLDLDDPYIRQYNFIPHSNPYTLLEAFYTFTKYNFIHFIFLIIFLCSRCLFNLSYFGDGDEWETSGNGWVKLKSC